MFKLLVIILTTFVSESFAQACEFAWPENKKAAVSLTYDDGMQTHLENAIPALNDVGIRGTFYLNGTR